MMTVNEVTKLTGISARTLHYYDQIGLLPPTSYTASGYRLYSDSDLEKLQQILLFRELEFSLEDIKKIVNSPTFDRCAAIEQHIKLLLLKKEHLEHLIAFAQKLQSTGGKHMDFKAFDKSKLNEYANEAKKTWGKTAEYKEFEEKDKKRTTAETLSVSEQLMAIIAEFGNLKALSPDDPAVSAQVKKLQNHITKHYYTCSDTILSQLGQMYAAGGEFTKNINAAGGEGCAEFTNKAIQSFCKKTKRTS